MMYHCLTNIPRYTLSAVLVDFSEEMCPNEAGGCSFTKQGLLQTALVVVYLLVSTYFFVNAYHIDSYQLYPGGPSLWLPRRQILKEASGHHGRRAVGLFLPGLKLYAKLLAISFC